MVGRTLKHYRVEEILGKGGMGVVYRAHDTKLQRDVALKVLPEGLTEDAGRKARFLREARAAGGLNHPAIAQVYDVDEADEVTFIAMELVDGRTVRYTATVLGDPSGHTRIRARMRQKYGLRDRWVALLFDTSRSRAVRLAVAAP